jgi:hypothetical protein
MINFKKSKITITKINMMIKILKILNIYRINQIKNKIFMMIFLSNKMIGIGKKN